MGDNQFFPNSTPDQERRQRPYYPPPNEAFMVLVAAIASALIVGPVLVDLGKWGLFLAELIFILPPLVYLQVKGYPIKRCLRWNEVSVPLVISALLMGLALTVLLDEADRLINLIFPMPEELQKLLQDFLKLKTTTDYLLVGSGAVLAAAIFEESLFRGFMQVSMEAYGSITRAVLFCALLFALAHFNPWWLVQILILGVFLGFVSWRANSSIPGMFIHGLNNGLALITGGALVGEKWSWYNLGDHVSPTVLIGAAALLFVAMKSFLRMTEESFPETVVRDESAPG